MRLIVLVTLLASLSLLEATGQVDSSSYLDDYFLPTAKLALNKLQQTLSPSNGQRESASATADTTTTTTTTTSQATEQRPNQSRAAEPTSGEVVPNKGQFVRIQTAGSDGGETSQLPVDSITTTSITTSTVGPVDSAGVRSSEPEVGSTQDGRQVEGSSISFSSPITTTTTTTPTTTTISSISPTTTETNSMSTSTTPSPSSSSSSTIQESTRGQTTELPAVSSSSSETVEPSLPTASVPIEEAAREAELEAVAAVEASIGFNSDLFGGSSDKCYDEYGNARYCEPSFEDLATEKQVMASSECGSPPSRFCTVSLQPNQTNVRNCHICDSQQPKKRHPAAYLTDFVGWNDPNYWSSPTCWVSAPLSSDIALSADRSPETPLRGDNVTLVLNLDKKFELNHIGLRFCSPRPDSLAIYKSIDMGRTWEPYRFVSSQCQRLYSRPTSSDPVDYEATCVTPSSAELTNMVFSTQAKSRPATSGDSRALDWMTATNLKIVLDRHQISWIQANSVAAHHPAQRQSTSGLNNSTLTLSQVKESQQQQQPETSPELTSPSDTYNYAVGSLEVVGRCKCNGHASSCIHSRDGRLQCDCRHNTAGRDCERCAPFHFDKPWARATILDANPCQPCDCNGHSRKCKFDPELYELSGRQSGGVCIGCRDNTAGRRCNYCKEGFTRDHSKPMTDKEACKPCDCHPIGSLGRACNHTSGQCACKEGATGLQCNRCAPGYQQSSSPFEPCIKAPENDINYEPPPQTSSDDGSEQTGSGAQPDSQPKSDSERQMTTSDRSSSGGSQDQPNDRDQSVDLDNEPASGGQVRQRQRPNNYWPRARPTNSNWYSRPAHHYEPAVDDQMDEDGPLPAGDYLPNRGYQYPAGGRATSRGQGRVRPGQSRARPPPPLPVANYDPGQEDLNAIDESPMESGGRYGGHYGHYQEDNFNHIQVPTRQHQQQHQQQQQQQQQHGSTRNHIATNLAANRGQMTGRQPIYQSNQQNLACGDCQTATKRLGFRRFCQHEFAIKAALLDKYEADDWTRVDVEIQDIFKSPQMEPQNSLTIDQVAIGTGSSLELARSTRSNNTDLLPSSIDDSEIGLDKPTGGQSRIRIGRVQSIWLPTEDLACRCPRLRSRQVYLMMGSVDSRENSANSLQLDRHGVAIEWRPSLQKKLIGYQRRRARGLC